MKRNARNRRRLPPAELMPTSASSENGQASTTSYMDSDSNSSDDNSKQQNCCKLLEIHQIPTHLRFNKYVLTHYRPAMDFAGCLKSLFYLHNETVNILTHGMSVMSFHALVELLPLYLTLAEIFCFIRYLLTKSRQRRIRAKFSPSFLYMSNSASCSVWYFGSKTEWHGILICLAHLVYNGSVFKIHSHGAFTGFLWQNP